MTTIRRLLATTASYKPLPLRNHFALHCYQSHQTLTECIGSFTGLRQTEFLELPTQQNTSPISLLQQHKSVGCIPTCYSSNSIFFVIHAQRLTASWSGGRCLLSPLVFHTPEQIVSHLILHRYCCCTALHYLRSFGGTFLLYAPRHTTVHGSRESVTTFAPSSHRPSFSSSTP